jgi:hypothetical protein
MNTKILTTESLKAIWGEIFFNKQTKVTKITDESVNNAMCFADARLAQIALKEIALIESNVFPQYASGTQLDYAGDLFSSITRYGASGSSTYLLIVGDSGTTYVQSNTTFTGNHGIVFTLVEDFTIDDNGFGYAKVSSSDTGVKTNVDPNSITIVSPEPTGHIGVTNEFAAIYGRDVESDEDFRSRIKSHLNIQAQKTLSYLLEICRLFNTDILLLQNLGFDESGVLQIGILTQNGTDLTQPELDSLLDSVKDYFALSDLNNQGEVVGVKLLNITYFSVGGDTTGVDFRVSLLSNYDVDTVRKNIQINMSRFLDPRNWVSTNSIQWTDLLRIAKETEGVKFVPDNYFYPSTDQSIPVNNFPRILRFVMRDLNGNIISDNAGVITPVFYPNN